MGDGHAIPLGLGGWRFKIWDATSDSSSRGSFRSPKRFPRKFCHFDPLMWFSRLNSGGGGHQRGDGRLNSDCPSISVHRPMDTNRKRALFMWFSLFSLVIGCSGDGGLVHKLHFSLDSSGNAECETEFC